MTGISLAESYDYCHRTMRSAARNFYFGMRLLPEPKRHAMHALYTFMRHIDDLADSPPAPGTTPRASLEQWRQATRQALAGEVGTHPLWPAFLDSVQRFNIPAKLFDDAIDGQLQDLDQQDYITFDELYQYCYRVASTVGIAALYIWGFEDPAAVKLAEYRGIAMQLTNILRDLREDAARGRCYLPAEERTRFQCDGWAGAAINVPPGFDRLMEFQCARAADYYDQSAPLDAMIQPDSRRTLRVMTQIYRGILDRISAKPRKVLTHRVGLPTLRKYLLVLQNAWRPVLN